MGVSGWVYSQKGAPALRTSPKVPLSSSSMKAGFECVRRLLGRRRNSPIGRPNGQGGAPGGLALRLMPAPRAWPERLPRRSPIAAAGQARSRGQSPGPIAGGREGGSPTKMASAPPRSAAPSWSRDQVPRPAWRPGRAERGGHGGGQAPEARSRGSGGAWQPGGGSGRPYLYSWAWRCRRPRGWCGFVVGGRRRRVRGGWRRRARPRGLKQRPKDTSRARDTHSPAGAPETSTHTRSAGGNGVAAADVVLPRPLAPPEPAHCPEGAGAAGPQPIVSAEENASGERSSRFAELRRGGALS